MSLSGLEVVHDTLSGGEDGETELSGGEDLGDDILESVELDVESGGDNSALVESSVQVDNNLAGSLIVNDFEVVDVT